MAGPPFQLEFDEGVEVVASHIGDVEVAQEDVGDVVLLLPFQQEVRQGTDLVESALDDALGVLLAAVVDVDRTEAEVEPSGAEGGHVGGAGKLL